MVLVNKHLRQAWASVTWIGHQFSYRLICPVDPNQEQWLSNEEADAEVFVDGVAVTLKPTEEAKGEDADQQANQRQQDAHPCDHV